jgi:hypothetical protein
MPLVMQICHFRLQILILRCLSFNLVRFFIQLLSELRCHLGVVVALLFNEFLQLCVNALYVAKLLLGYSVLAFVRDCELQLGRESLQCRLKLIDLK